ncbi:MAG: FMN-binding protein [Victivallaceae bacterium]|nr:FMN-binding protein [Victivallaceae bacterium]
MSLKLKDTENIWVLGLFLGLCGAAAALVLAYFDDLTRAPISKMKMLEVDNALREVLPAFDNSPGINVCRKDGVTFYGAQRNGKLIAVAASGDSMKGYSGRIAAMVGLNLDGKVRTIAIVDGKKLAAVLITEQNETPGLGTVVCERKRQKTIFSIFKKPGKAAALPPPNPILDQFAGRSAGATPWRVIKDGGKCDYLTGATISSRAVTGVVYRIAHAFAAHRQEIIARLSQPQPQN